jgi:hypothetical protein
VHITPTPPPIDKSIHFVLTYKTDECFEFLVCRNRGNHDYVLWYRANSWRTRESDEDPYVGAQTAHQIWPMGTETFFSDHVGSLQVSCKSMRATKEEDTLKLQASSFKTARLNLYYCAQLDTLLELFDIITKTSIRFWYILICNYVKK